MKRNPFSVRRVILILLVCFMSSSVMAQKVNRLDTLNIDQLNLYKHKAVTMRNAGMILTFGGIGIVVTGFIVGNKIANTPSDDPYDPNKNEWKGLGTGLLVGMAGMATIVVGVPLYAIGGSRYSKAELALQKLNIAPINSMALGVGIALSF